MTKEQIEAKARELWEQRERATFTMWRIKSTSWDNAPEGGKNLMRLYAKAGQQHWLDTGVKLDPDELQKHNDKYFPAKKPRTQKPITEEVVEGIYAENQYKCETIEGYAAAFERVHHHMRKQMLDKNYKPSEQEETDFQAALSELMLLDIMHNRLK